MAITCKSLPKAAEAPIERLMGAITIDYTKLSPEEADDLLDFIYHAIQHGFCPGDFTISACPGDCEAPRENWKRKATTVTETIGKDEICHECITCWCSVQEQEEF